MNATSCVVCVLRDSWVLPSGVAILSDIRGVGDAGHPLVHTQNKATRRRLGDGWTRRDSGDGGYSRTLGGDGGISAEYNAYNDAVMNNEFDIMMNGGWWGDTVYLGGIGWGGRYGASQ